MEVISSRVDSILDVSDFRKHADDSYYDKAKEVKAFDDTKAGVKGLVDSGVTKIPRFFIHRPENVQRSSSSETSNVSLQVPVIDLEGYDSYRRAEVVSEIRKAAQTWGFFQMVNHGPPVSVLEEMLGGVRRFHEQPQKKKAEFYSRDARQRVRFFCNGDLLVNKGPANWRDTIAFEFEDGKLEASQFPDVCREAVSEYIKEMRKVKVKVSEVLSEAMGVRREYLERMECMERESVVCHYYPVCPEPELTLGTTKHTDPSFLTILLQDNTGGLQVLYRNNWVDVPPRLGALVVNLGDFMQLISNGKLRSVEHRVVVGGVGHRASVACFFYPSTANKFTPYGPLQELLHGDPPIYRPTHITEFMAYFRSKGLDGTPTLSHFQLSS